MKELFKPKNQWDVKSYNLMLGFVKRIKKYGKLLERQVETGKNLMVACSWGDEKQVWQYGKNKYLLIYEDNMDARDRARVLTAIYKL